jgi:exonuclease SbcD
MQEKDMNQLRCVHTGDVHFAPETLEQVIRCFSYVVDHAIEVHCDVAIIAGDFFDHKLDAHSPALLAAIKQVRRLADVMPTVMLAGTFSHDAPNSLKIFQHIKSLHPIHVADEIQQVALVSGAWIRSSGWAFDNVPPGASLLVSCLPAVNKGAVAAAVGAEHAAEAVGGLVADLLKGWSTSNLAARAAGIPTVVTAHGTVTGAINESGVPMMGLDNEMTSGALFAAEASACCVAHIHKFQAWKQNDRAIAYCSSPARLHFGELDPKGFLIWNLRPDGADFQFIETPAKRLLQIDFPGVPDMAELERQAVNADGAHVRIRYSVDVEHRHAIDRAAITRLFEKAANLQIEGHVNQIQRSRSEGMNRAPSLSDKLSKWADVTQTDKPPLLERLSSLETYEPEKIVAMILQDKSESQEEAA